MYSLIRIASAVVFVAAAVLVGCGPSGGAVQGNDGGPLQPTTGPYQPLEVGWSWTYNINQSGAVSTKVMTVEGTDTLDGPKAGLVALRTNEQVEEGTQLTWYTSDGTLVMRHKEQTHDASGLKKEDIYDPYRLRLDESAAHTAAGASWSETFSVTQTSRSRPTAETTSQTVTWTVEAVDEVVSVPAGTFNAMRITRTDQADGSVKTFWFTRGIGKVREQAGGGRIEELTAYHAP